MVKIKIEKKKKIVGEMFSGSKIVLVMPIPLSNDFPLKIWCSTIMILTNITQMFLYNHNLNNAEKIKSSIRILVDLYILSDTESFRNLYTK